MKSANAQLIALLNSSNQFQVADLYTLTLIGGGVFYYTSWDVDVSYSGHTYSSVGALFDRSKVRIVLGIEVDEMDLTVYASPTLLINGVPFLQAVQRGAMDGASVRLDRAFMSVPPAVVGTLYQFGGNVASVRAGRSNAQFKIKSDLELLNVQMPRNLYQPGCLHTLYDTDCGLTKAALKVSSAASTGSTDSVIDAALAQGDGHFSLGTVAFTGGANSGMTRTIKQHASGALQLILPLPVAPSAGDTFDCYPGCDKQQATCTAKFNNLTNFRGMPYIPVPETAR